MTNKTNDSNQHSNYREIASAIKKSIEASGRVPPHKSVGGVLYRFLCTVSGNDVTLRSNNWTVADWENSTINASIKYTLTESEHVKWNNVQVAAETLLSQIVFSNKDDIFGLFLKWIKSEKETSMYTPSGFLPHGITETIKTHNESEKQKTFNLLRRVFKTNYDSTLVHIVNAMADQPSTEDTFVALSEKAMAELLKHGAENIKLKAINSSLTAANNNLRHNDNNNPDILKITRDSVFNRLKGLFPDNKPEFIRLLAESFVDNKQTKNKYHVTDAAELFNKDADIYHYKNQIECLLHEAKVKSMKIVELEQQIADLHRRYTTPVIAVGSVAPTIPKEPLFDAKKSYEHLKALVTLQETRLQKLENQQNPAEVKTVPTTPPEKQVAVVRNKYIPPVYSGLELTIRNIVTKYFKDIGQDFVLLDDFNKCYKAILAKTNCEPRHIESAILSSRDFLVYTLDGHAVYLNKTVEISMLKQLVDLMVNSGAVLPEGELSIILTSRKTHHPLLVKAFIEVWIEKKFIAVQRQDANGVRLIGATNIAVIKDYIEQQTV